MIWAYLAILGRIILLGYEKIVVKKVGENNDSMATSFLFFALAILFLFPFVFLDKIPKNLEFLPYGLTSSFIYSLSFFLYVKSLSLGEASLVGPLYNFNVFFLLLLTTIFLGEAFTINKLIGLSLLVYGASFLNRQENVFKSLKILIKKKESFLMILSSLLIAIGRTIDGFLMGKISALFYTFFLYFAISVFQFLYLLIGKKLREVAKVFKNNTLYVFIASAINAYSYLLLLIAFKKVPVSIAEPLSMLSMILTVIFAHYLLKENIGLRIVGVLIMILGSFILFL
ncbi:MAG: hypothetical protein CBR30_03090 [Dictyoglomus sp. NZ13-RE01]|nr:MAG: hypothetical protein CBR30_03090 [Dictyoglomus sp. NZ13-RE01]